MSTLAPNTPIEIVKLFKWLQLYQSAPGAILLLWELSNENAIANGKDESPERIFLQPEQIFFWKLKNFNSIFGIEWYRKTNPSDKIMNYAQAHRLMVESVRHHYGYLLINDEFHLGIQMTNLQLP